MRFQFIHAADVHLDSPMRGLARRGEAASPFLAATRDALENMVDLAVERAVRFVLISGDLYDGDWRDWASGQFAIKQFGRLGRAGIDVYMIRGNHDAQSVISRELPLPEHVKELSVKKVQTVELPDVGAVIHGRGFATRHVEENVVAGYPQATPGAFNIGMLHTSMTGRDGHGVYAPCSVEDLLGKGYQYWALGHIHKREVLRLDDQYIVYPGNLQGRHAKETGAKGVTLVTVDKGRVVEIENVPCDVARFDTRDVDLDGASDKATLFSRVAKVAQAAVAKAEDRPLSLRLRLVGRTTLGGLVAADPEALREEIQALAWSTSDTLLIEKVEDASSKEGGTMPAVPHFDEILKDCANDPAFHASLAATLSDLRSKLPPEALALMEHGGGSLEGHVSDALSAATRSVAARIGMEAST